MSEIEQLRKEIDKLDEMSKDDTISLDKIHEQSNNISALVENFISQTTTLQTQWADIHKVIKNREDNEKMAEFYKERELFKDTYTTVNATIAIMESDIRKICDIFNKGDMAPNVFKKETDELLGTIHNYINGKNDPGAFIIKMQSVCRCPKDKQICINPNVMPRFECYKSLINRKLVYHNKHDRALLTHNELCGRCEHIICEECHSYLKREECDRCSAF